MTVEKLALGQNIIDQIGNAKILLEAIEKRSRINVDSFSRHFQFPTKIKDEVASLVKNHIKELEKEFEEL